MKPHIVLINPRIREWNPNVRVPLGLAYVAAALEQEDNSVEIIDLNAKHLSDTDLQRMAKDASIVGITGMVTEYSKVLKLVGIIKEGSGNLKVILGGPLATTLGQELLRACEADFVVMGEGERTVVSLVSAIERGDSPSCVSGIAYRDGDEITVARPAEQIEDLDTIPFPARHLLDMKRYLKNHFESFGLRTEGFGKIRSTNLITSRGCPYRCTFCFKGVWGQKWRARSPENIVKEMEQLYTTYGINGFFFDDDTFVLDNRRVLEFCSLLKRRGLDAVWYCNGRANLMQKESLEAMYDAGCRGIAYGIESGNQHVLDSMKKETTLDQVRNAVKWTKEAGINASGYFMLGMLGETRESIRETITLAKELDLGFYGFSIATPFLGTELYSVAEEAGLVQRDMNSLKEWGFHVNANLTHDCTDSDLAAFENEAFKEFTLKRFGKYYFFNPIFLRQAAKVLLSLQSRNEVKELAGKIWGVIRSYWHRPRE